MALWEIAVTIAGAVGIGFLLDKLSGGLIQTIVTKIVDVIQDMVNFLLDNLPKPLKMAIFLILFVTLGSVLYNWTVGAQYICLDDEVNRVDITEGLAANLWPPDIRDEYNDPEQGELLGNTNTSLSASEAVGVKGSGTTSWAIRRDSPFTFIGEELIADSEYNGKDEVLYENKGETLQGVEFNSLVYALVSQGDKISALWLNEIFRLNNYDFFQAWLGSDDLKLVYDVCHDSSTSTCTLRRTDKSSWGEYVDAELSADQPGEGCNIRGAYGTRVGRVSYTLEDGTLYGATVGDLGLFNKPAHEVCKSGNAVQRDQGDEPIHDALLGTEENPTQAVDVEFRWRNSFGVNQHETVPLYGVQHAPVMKDIRSSNNTFVNKLYQDPDNQVDRNQNELRELFDNPEPLESQEGQLVTFSCNQDTEEDEYDTVMYLGGIDVFDPKLMFLFVLSSLIIGFYRSLDVL